MPISETAGQLQDGFSLRAVTDMDGLRSLRPDWDRLCDVQGCHSPFLCFDWFHIWLKYFLKNDALMILVLYKDNRIIAIAPFLTTRGTYKIPATVRRIALIGNVHSPMRNILFGDIDTETRERCCLQMFSAFRSRYRDWDVIELDSIPEENGNADILYETAKRLGMPCVRYVSFADWYLDGLTCSGEEYIQMLPKKLRNELTRRKRRLGELGKVSVEVGDSMIQLSRYMELYNLVRERSWKSRENDPEFLSEIRRMFCEKGMLRYGFLFIDSRPIAAQIRVVSNRIVYLLEAVHDRELNQFGPGHVLRAEMTKHLIDRDQIREIDQVRGDEAYKSNWTPLRRERRGLIIFNDSFKGNLLNLLYFQCLPFIDSSPQLSSFKRRLAGITRV